MDPVYCPECGKSVSFDEKLARRCAACGTPLSGAEWARPDLTADVPTRPRPPTAGWTRPDEAPDRDVARRPRVADESILGWGTVRAGLALSITGVAAFFVSLIVGFSIAAEAVGKKDPGTSTEYLSFLFGVGMIAGAALAGAGTCMGCAAPSESGARGWAIGATACVGLVILLVPLLEAAEREQSRAEFNKVLGEKPAASAWTEKGLKNLRYCIYGLVIVGNVFNMLFLYQVAAYFRHRGLGVGLLIYLFLSLLYSIGVMLLREGAFEITLRPKGGVESSLWLFLGSGVALSVWFVVLVGMVRGTVTRGVTQS
jgi:hypothetical protein